MDYGMVVLQVGHEKDFKRCDALELECQDQV